MSIYSARVQSIDAQRHPFMRGVLERFAAATGCPVMVNTSFNVRGEPIVNSAEDAYRCFMATEIDCLVVGNRWLERDRQKNYPLTETELRALVLRRFELGLGNSCLFLISFHSFCGRGALTPRGLEPKRVGTPRFTIKDQILERGEGHPARTHIIFNPHHAIRLSSST